MLEDPWEELQERERRRTFLSALLGWLFFVVFLIVMAAIFAAPAHARALYRFSIDGLTITLHSDRCALLEVANLPNRATWHEPGKPVVEGCYGYDGRLGVVLTYWADKTVAALPASMFHRIVET